MGRRGSCRTGLGKSLGEHCTLVSTSCLFLEIADKRPGTVSGGVSAVCWWHENGVAGYVQLRHHCSSALLCSIFLFPLRQLIMLSGLYSHICFLMGVGNLSSLCCSMKHPPELLAPSSLYCPPTLMLSHLLSCSKSWCDCLILGSSWLDL
jgi:hypothetical protein